MTESVDRSWARLGRRLEQFFPVGVMLPDAEDAETHAIQEHGRVVAAVTPTPDRQGVAIDWRGRRRIFRHGDDAPFLDSEVAIVECTLSFLEKHFGDDSSLSSESAEDEDLPDDTIIANYLGTPEPRRLVAALAVLRAAALSTYENRQLSTGALLLGSNDGSEGGPTLPVYDLRLSGVKGFHRLCDGVHSLFIVGLDGRIRHAVDVKRWAEEHGAGVAIGPCPRSYEPHARATAEGGHTALVLMPSHEIKVFHGGHFACAFSVARWRILDIPTKARLWSEAVTDAALATFLFGAALDMSESRHGALFVVLDDAEASVGELVAPSDRLDALQAPVVAGSRPLAPRSKLIFANMLTDVKRVTDLDRSVLESLASLDGAIVMDRRGTLLSFGAILRVPRDAVLPARNPDGARTTIALIAAQYAAVLKVSEDGVLTMYHRGRRVWDL